MTASVGERIVHALQASGRPLSDAELRAAIGATSHQQVNQACRKLVARGILTRSKGFEGTIANTLAIESSTVLLHPAASSEQQRAEVEMLTVLSTQLGVKLRPRHLRSPSGAMIKVDGVAVDGSVLVECWAHQGTAKVAQKWKLMNDAAKLHWAASWVVPTPSRLVVCVSDESAVKHLRGASWQGHAIRDMGVKVEVVQLPAELSAAVALAQRRQGQVESYSRRTSGEEESDA